MRPYGFKTIAFLGIFVNILSLCIAYPLILALYNAYGETLKPFEVFMLFIDTPIGIILTSMLLLGSIGLLRRQEWGRKLCVIGLSMNIGYGICSLTVDVLYNLIKWNEKSINSLITIPIVIAMAILEICIVIYLRSAETKKYLNS